MTPIGAGLVVTFFILILILPQKYSSLPFFLTIYYIPSGEMLTIGGFNVFSSRIILIATIIRIISRGELKKIHLQRYEYLLFAMFIWLAFASGIREKSLTVLVNSFSRGFDAVLTYLYARSTVREVTDIRSIANIFCIIVIPLMILLVAEKINTHNYFSVMNTFRSVPLIRHGKVRAAGPFAHSILAGTAAAVHIPLAIYAFSRSKIIGIAGAAAILGIIYASASSGPIMTMAFGCLAMGLWMKRQNLVKYRTTFYWLVIVLEILKVVSKKGHVWDYLARIDLTGSSTGWHRSAIITAALTHFGEWWLIGTNYTRHWMPTGVSWSPNHTDITNHVILQGVDGGLFVVIVFVYFIYKSFKNVGILLRSSDDITEQFTYWTLGAIMFAHTATFISVAYFDQTVTIYYFLMGAIAALYTNKRVVPVVMES